MKSSKCSSGVVFASVIAHFTKLSLLPDHLLKASSFWLLVVKNTQVSWIQKTCLQQSSFLSFFLLRKRRLLISYYLFSTVLIISPL